MVLNIYAFPIFILLSRGQKDYHAPLAHMALVGGGCIYRRCIAVGEMGSRVRNIRPSVVTGVHYNGCIVPSKPIYSGHSEYALKAINAIFSLGVSHYSIFFRCQNKRCGGTSWRSEGGAAQ